MIQLDIYNAQTYYSGPEIQLEIMYEALRVEDKRGAYWKAKSALKWAGIKGRFEGMSKDEKEEERERIRLEASYIKFYDNRSNCFGTGLLNRVRTYLRTHGVKVQLSDHRRTIGIRSKQRRLKATKIQRFRFVDKVETRPEQLEALRESLIRGRGILSCATNSGKTDIACAIYSEYSHWQHRVACALFLVHRQQLVLQTMGRFKAHLGDSTDITYIGAGRKSIPSGGILVATVQTAINLQGSKTWKDFMEKCDILFIDEFHINKAWSVSKLVKGCSAPMRFGLSGTINREDQVKLMHYKAMTGPIVAEISNEELVKLGRSAKPVFRMVEVHSNEVHGNYASAYKVGIVKNAVRNKIAVREGIRYLDKDFRVLVMVSRIAHGIKLLKRFRKRTDIPCEFMSGSTPLFVRESLLKKFKAGKLPLLITSPITDVGMDIPAIDAAVLCGGGRGWELILQRLGRLLRKKEGENKVYVTDFIDLQNEYLLKHSLARLNYYKKENIGVIKIVEKA